MTYDYCAYWNGHEVAGYEVTIRGANGDPVSLKVCHRHRDYVINNFQELLWVRHV